MGVRNAKLEQLRRVESKSLDAQFTRIIESGLNCSPFEAQAVLGVVHEVYFPYLDEACSSAPPGKICVVAVSAEEPAGKAIAQCEKVTVCLTVHRGAEDDALLTGQGPTAFRRARLADLCQQALSQGGLLTRADLAHHVFYVGVRTISRDLAQLRRQEPAPVIPLRSTVQDIGPVLSHRVEIVRLALEGKTTTQICRIMRHSPTAVANYLSTFARCAFLAREGLEDGQIAFLLRRGKGLIARYRQLAEAAQADRNQRYHLDEFVRIEAAGKKNPQRKGGKPYGRSC